MSKKSPHAPEPPVSGDAPGSAPDYVHIDDWMDTPGADETERLVKEWFRHFRRPAIEKDHKWLGARVLTCDYKRKRYRCIGCSRMGDVWLTPKMDAEYGYEHRVEITECSKWSVRQKRKGQRRRAADSQMKPQRTPAVRCTEC